MQAVDGVVSPSKSGGGYGDEPIRPGRVQLMRALRAFRRLLADKEDTAQVFEIMQALNGRSTARSYQRLIGTVRGGRIAYERQELAAYLSSSRTVEGFSDASVGGAYRRFVRSENLTAAGLAEESRRARGGAADAAHPLAWFGRRIRDTHDIWHVLTGYGRDGLGELCLVAFSFAQTGSLGWAFIAVGGVLQGMRSGQGRLVTRAVWQAYRNGRAAAWLPGEDVPTLLDEPLEVARDRLTIRPPTAYRETPGEVRKQTMGRGILSRSAAS